MNANTARAMTMEGQRQQRIKDQETLDKIENAIKVAALKGDTKVTYNINFSRVSEIAEILENEGYTTSIFNSGRNEQSFNISWESIPAREF